jgi:hypothetical protein
MTNDDASQDREYEEGASGTKTKRKDDPLTEYREKEAMTPEKIKEHEPRAVKREMTEKITDVARSKGMAKGRYSSSRNGDGDSNDNGPEPAGEDSGGNGDDYT